MTAFLLTNARWLATGFVLAFASSFGQTWFISLFAGEIRAEYGLSNGQWGALYTVATLCSAGLLLSRGALADTMRLSRLVPLTALLYAAAMGLVALGHSVWLLGVAVFLLRFCGQGMFSHISVTAMGRWFVAARGRAVAIAGMGHPAGEALLPFFFVAAIAGIGWRETWGLTAAILLLLLLPLLMLLLAQDREPGRLTGHVGSTGIGGRDWTRKEALRHWLFPSLLPVLITPGFIGTVVFFHQVHVSEVKGWTLVQMAPGYTAYAGVTVVVSLLAGWACDRFGAHRLLPGLLVPMGIAMFLIGPAQSPWVWVLALGILAMTQGTASALWGAFWPTVYGTRHLGSVRSLQVAIAVLSTAIGPGITGLLIDFGIPFPDQGAALGLWCLGLSIVLIFVSRRIASELAPEEA